MFQVLIVFMSREWNYGCLTSFASSFFTPQILLLCNKKKIVSFFSYLDQFLKPQAHKNIFCTPTSWDRDQKNCLHSPLDSMCALSSIHPIAGIQPRHHTCMMMNIRKIPSYNSFKTSVPQVSKGSEGVPTPLVRDLHISLCRSNEGERVTLAGSRDGLPFLYQLSTSIVV